MSQRHKTAATGIYARYKKSSQAVGSDLVPGHNSVVKPKEQHIATVEIFGNGDQGIVQE